MQKITDYIFNLSPKKLAVYLVLVPLILLLANTIISISFGTISQHSFENQITATILIGILVVVLSVLVFIWLIWLRSTVYAISEKELALARKWFQIAYLFLWVFLIFNLVAFVLENYIENDSSNAYLNLIHVSREFINFAAIMIAYPITCHYVARSVMVKQSGKPATFLGAIPYTLVLVFGVVLAIPFMHNYYSSKDSKKSEILIIYAISFSLFMLILVIGFIASITGMV